MSCKALYQQIEELSAEITMLTDKNELEQVNEKLAARLDLLKKLSAEVLATSSELQNNTLRIFLEKIQQQDNQQLEKLLNERTKVLADSQKQSQIKKAVNTYQQFSGS